MSKRFSGILAVGNSKLEAGQQYLDIATGKDAVMAVSSTDEVYAIASTSALNDQKGVDLVLNKELRPTQFASLSGNDAMTAKLTVCLDGCGKFIVSDSDLDMCPSCSASLDKVTDARIASHCMSEDVPHSEGGLVSTAATKQEALANFNSGSLMSCSSEFSTFGARQDSNFDPYSGFHVLKRTMKSQSSAVTKSNPHIFYCTAECERGVTVASDKDVVFCSHCGNSLVESGEKSEMTKIGSISSKIVISGKSVAAAVDSFRKTVTGERDAILTQRTKFGSFSSTCTMKFDPFDGSKVVGHVKESLNSSVGNREFTDFEAHLFHCVNDECDRPYSISTSGDAAFCPHCNSPLDECTGADIVGLSGVEEAEDEDDLDLEDGFDDEDEDLDSSDEDIESLSDDEDIDLDAEDEEDYEDEDEEDYEDEDEDLDLDAEDLESLSGEEEESEEDTSEEDYEEEDLEDDDLESLSAEEEESEEDTSEEDTSEEEESEEDTSEEDTSEEEESEDEDLSEEDIDLDTSEEEESEDEESEETSESCESISMLQALSSVTDIDPTQISMSFAQGLEPRWHMFYQGSPICYATLTSVSSAFQDEAKARKMFSNPQFAQAVSLSCKEHGLHETIADFGFKSHSFDLQVGSILRNKYKAEADNRVNQVQKEIDSISADYKERYSAALGISLSGTTSKFWKGIKNPVAEALINSLSAAGVANPREIVEQAFIDNGQDLFSTVMTKADELMSQSAQTQEELAQAIMDHSPRATVSESKVLASTSSVADDDFDAKLAQYFKR